MTYRYKTVKRGGKTVLLHRWLVEQQVGRPLRRDEHVHHRNGNCHDNRLENLQLMTVTEHQGHHKNKHPRTKACVICGLTFTPLPTKRARTLVCGWRCRSALIAVKRHGVSIEEARRRWCPELVEQLVRANIKQRQRRAA